MAEFEYVRREYGVPAEWGRGVVVYGRPGVIVADRGHYIGVTFDADRPGVISNVHPTSEVVYGELRPIRTLTRAQKRYRDYLDVSDCYESFGHYLRFCSHGAKA